MFKKNYEIIQNAPAPISWDEYSRSSYDEYQSLLQKCGNDESAFQHFLERNPSFVPGPLNCLVLLDIIPLLNH